jgi:uncharacterized membrane protein YedE/YeeE
MKDLILSPWPWYVAGPLITLSMVSLLLLGKRFGLSSNFKTLCAIAGAGKVSDFFRFDWKKDIWNLAVVLGSMIGGYVAYNYLGAEQGVKLSESTQEFLQSKGIRSAGFTYQPDELFSVAALQNGLSWTFLLLGGFLVGFGTRYAGGCTSGHAISGLSNLQLPSLIAVVGFFIGGLTFTWLILPNIL